MRPDSIGLFWEDLPRVVGRGRKGANSKDWGPIPEIPDTGWKPPSEFPNLSAARVLGIDCETFDPELNTAGPGWGRGSGHIVGVSVSVPDRAWYFPIRHETQPEYNLDPDQVKRFLQDTLADNRPKVGANLIYDLGWLDWEGIKVGGRLYDVQFAEALLNSEAPDVRLEELASSYLGVGKDSSILYDWLARWNGKAANDRQRQWIYKAPPSLVGPYAESDAELPIRILSAQWPKLQARGVLDLFDLECRLIPLLVAMRRKGAPVNINRAEQIYENLGVRLEALEARIKDIAGQPVNPDAGETIRRAFIKLGIPLPTKIDKKTSEEKVSFAAPLLEQIDHPLCEAILEHRKLTKVRSVFIGAYVLKKHVKGRIHCSFHPLRNDEGGARSGRFSSSDPNLQNIPVRTEEGRLVREVFEAAIRWRSIDYSSIEYRLLAHFAVGEGADEVRAILRADPTADYHAIVGKLIEKLTGLVLPRGRVKTINFGIIYGMALAALTAALNLPRNEAKRLLDSYHQAIPYARATMDDCANEVHRTGSVRTLLGRVSDFTQWGPKGFSGERRSLPYDEACRKWGPYNIERQHTHKALNRKLQGSAADVMKKAMVDAYEAGLFADDACGIPLLTVHDELDFEDNGDPDNKAWLELKHVMENCAAHLLRVPLLVDVGTGKTWADAH
jgi:DNA polymerase I-like protein with 3'-5' exonuclease and polymerase domains